MRIFTKSIIIISSILFSSSIFAFECPPAGGPYALTGHNANGTRCVYTSDKEFQLNIQGTKLIKPNCPRPLITDPHYQDVQCHHDAIKKRCICVAVRH